MLLRKKMNTIFLYANKLKNAVSNYLTNDFFFELKTRPVLAFNLSFFACVNTICSFRIFASIFCYLFPTYGKWLCPLCLSFSYFILFYYDPEMFVMTISYPFFHFCIHLRSVGEDRFLKYKIQIWYWCEILHTKICNSNVYVYQRHVDFLEHVLLELAIAKRYDLHEYFITHPIMRVHSENFVDTYYHITNLSRHAIRVGQERGYKKFQFTRKFIRFARSHYSEDEMKRLTISLFIGMKENYPNPNLSFMQMIIDETKPKFSLIENVDLVFLHRKLLLFLLKREKDSDLGIILNKKEYYSYVSVRKDYRSANILWLYGAIPKISDFPMRKKWKENVYFHRHLSILYCLQKREISLFFFL